MMKFTILSALLFACGVVSFVPVTTFNKPSSGPYSTSRCATPGDGWQGEVVPNQGGMIGGCSVQAVGEEPVTEWILTIDG